MGYQYFLTHTVANVIKRNEKVATVVDWLILLSDSLVCTLLRGIIMDYEKLEKPADILKDSKHHDDQKGVVNASIPKIANAQKA